MKAMRHQVLRREPQTNRHAGVERKVDRPLPGRPVPAARAIYRQLGSIGMRPAEAGNLTAYLNGLTPVEGGWTIAEVERLLFARYLVDRGWLRS